MDGKGLVGAEVEPFIFVDRILGLTLPDTLGLLRPEPTLGLDLPERLLLLVRLVLQMSQVRDVGLCKGGVFS